MVIYRSKLHATLKRNYQLMNHIPDKYEQLVATMATTPTALAGRDARLRTSSKTVRAL